MFEILKVTVNPTPGEHIADAPLNSNDGLPGVGVHIGNFNAARSCGCARCLGRGPHG